MSGLAAEAGVRRSTAYRSASAVEALRSLQLARASEVDPERCPFDERQARNEHLRHTLAKAGSNVAVHGTARAAPEARLGG